MIGKVINKYRLDAKLGEGGMGVVYKAWDTVLERPVALKMLHPLLAQDEKFLKRFRSEGRALAKLVHPNIVTVFDLEEAEENLIIIMEYVEGVTLAEELKQSRPLPFDAALPIIKQVLSALGHAHNVGVIHRDIKPGNVMLTLQKHVKITDFGLAKVYTEQSLNAVHLHGRHVVLHAAGAVAKSGQRRSTQRYLFHRHDVLRNVGGETAI